MKKDNLIVGIAIIVCTLAPIASVSIYETTTGNYIGNYGVAFLIPICLGIFVTMTAFTKRKDK